MELLGHGLMPYLALLFRTLTMAYMVIREVRELISDFSHLQGDRQIITVNNAIEYVPYIEEDNMAEIMDKESIQLNMEKLYHKNQTLPRLYKEYESEREFFEPLFDEHGIPHAFGYDLMVQMALHKRANLPTLVGILRRHFKDSGPNQLQDTADMLLACCKADIVNWFRDLLMFVVKWNITEDVQEDLDRYQYPIPMVVEPKEIKTNSDTGYLTGSGSVILKNNHHEGDVCLEHLNRMNKIELSINFQVGTFIQNKWRHLDKVKPKESRKDYNARVKAFNKYDRTSRDVMDALAFTENRFYLTHKYDKRGRVYCQGYHVSYQGTAWNKAVIEFANKEIVC